MNNIQIFNNPDFGQVRAVAIEGNPWFVAADICEILNLSNTSVALSRLDPDERSKFNLGRQGDANMVNEYGLYSLILASRKPEAKKFKRWVTHEVLPSIRRHGMYATEQKLEEMLLNPDAMIKTLEVLKAEREERKRLEAEAAVNQPKVIFADAVATSKSSILVGELAKILKGNGFDIGQNRLFALLRDEGYLIKRKGNDFNMPTQRSMELGLFEIKETAVTHSDGHISVNKTPKVTGKGQEYFINRYLGREAA